MVAEDPQPPPVPQDEATFAVESTAHAELYDEDDQEAALRDEPTLSPPR